MGQSFLFLFKAEFSGGGGFALVLFSCVSGFWFFLGGGFGLFFVFCFVGGLLTASIVIVHYKILHFVEILDNFHLSYSRICKKLLKEMATSHLELSSSALFSQLHFTERQSFCSLILFLI